MGREAHIISILILSNMYAPLENRNYALRHRITHIIPRKEVVMGCCGDDDDEAPPPPPPPSLLAPLSDLLQPLNQASPSVTTITISPMNSNFSALLCQDTLRTILGRLSLDDLARSACVCRIWRSVASDNEMQIRAFMSPWKLRDVIGKPSSGVFWRDNSLSKFAVSHRIARSDSIASLAVKYSVQVLSYAKLF